ncbi:MAG: hypothetical protein MK101_10140 [Phycisphaerales bacterium]|nr:hypothetical protein [Phycisphaerales bacterium]
MDLEDLLDLVDAFGTSDGWWDLDESGTVDMADLIWVLLTWGECPS